jgi:hypothetical protein
MSPIARSAGVMALTALLYGLDIMMRLAILRFDPTLFIVAGSPTCDFSKIPIPVLDYKTGGYDGQYYFRLALDPLANQRTAFGITLDHPAYRQQRILYPALAHVLALGRARWVPWAMVLLNYAAICALGFTAGLFACAFGRHALWGLVIPFFPGLLFSINRDLTEVLAQSLTVGAIYLLHRRRLLAGAITLALALLARETLVVLAAGYFASWALRMRRGQARWSEGAALMIPLAAFSIWQLWIFGTWGSFGIEGAGPNLGPPFKVLWEVIATHLIGLPSPPRVLFLYELIMLGGIGLLAASAIFESPTDGGVKLAWAVYFAGALMFSAKVWINDEAFLRALSELSVLSLVILLGSSYSRLLRMVFVVEFVLWNFVALLPQY